MAEIEAALAAIPRRVSGLPEGDPHRHPYHRLVLAGLRDALYRLSGDVATASEQAVALMEDHSPSSECGWDVRQSLRSSLWLSEGVFWGRAIRCGWEATSTVGPAAGDGLEGPMPLGHAGEEFFYRSAGGGRIVSLGRGHHIGVHLVSIAPLGWWTTNFPREGGGPSGPPKGVNWLAAADAMFQRQNRVGSFDPNRQRGLGVWLDRDRVTWHQGARLVVDGQAAPLHGLETSFIYAPAPAVIGGAQPEPLDEATGRQVLEVLLSLGWPHPIEGVYLAGAAVLGPVSGALDRRPVLVITAQRGSGKTEGTLRPLRALWGGPGLHLHRSAPTEAHIRQTLGADSLPVAVDEWERVAGKRKTAFLEMLRVGFDGGSTGRGTAHGKALHQPVRALFVLAGINVSHDDDALHSRSVVIQKCWLPPEQWRPVEARLTQLITPELGQRLIARTTAHLHTLRHNIGVLQRTTAAQLTGTETDRLADVQAHLLAGALLLVSTRRLQGPDDAQRWLTEAGWSPGSDQSGAPDAGCEGEQALAHLLAFAIRWQPSDGDPTGSITVRELVATAGGRSTPAGTLREVLGHAAAARGREERKAAATALGRLGLKVEDGCLLVANCGAEVDKVFSTTRWAEGGHRARLLDLEGAEPTGRSVRFPSGPSQRAVRLPLGLVLGPEEEADL